MTLLNNSSHYRYSRNSYLINTQFTQNKPHRLTICNRLFSNFELCFEFDFSLELISERELKKTGKREILGDTYISQGELEFLLGILKSTTKLRANGLEIIQKISVLTFLRILAIYCNISTACTL